MAALVGFVILWQIGSTWHQWAGFRLPWIGAVPPPSEVFIAWVKLLGQWGYWESWYLSFTRVLSGFLAAMLFGIPLGLGMAVNRIFYDFTFPPFEILRPIPPLAWVPASLIFWPTQELSIAFVTFLGAFFAIVINVVGGAKSIDKRFLRAAQSMGATRWHLFWRVVLPGTLPSIFVGAAVGMGITLGGRCRRRNDLDRRTRRRRRARILYLELLSRRLPPPDRRRHDQHRHCRICFEFADPNAGQCLHAVAPTLLISGARDP